jgi:SAM-dependent methyltransferase
VQGESERPGGSGLRRLLRPIRRFLARFSLVYEQSDRALEEMRKELAALTARLVPEVERLRAETRRIQRENAAVVRLVAGSRGGEGPVRDIVHEGAEAAGASGTTPAILVLAGTPGLNRRGFFAETERGSRAEVASKLEGYVPLFDRGPILDLGCGRGEFLEVATRRGLSAYGVDSDEDAVRQCRELGLDARREDLFEHLRGLAPGSLGGVFCSQIVEHLPPDVLPDLMEEVARGLVAGGVAVFETPNPSSFATHVHSFWRDPTHIRPVPEAALALSARMSGLVVESTVYSSLPPPQDRLKPAFVESSDPGLNALVGAFNSMVEGLNDLLYGYQDYALVMRKWSEGRPEESFSERGRAP